MPQAHLQFRPCCLAVVMLSDWAAHAGQHTAADILEPLLTEFQCDCCAAGLLASSCWWCCAA